MLEKRKVLDQIEIKSDGVIFVKELVQIVENVEDGIVVHSSVPHRTAITPDMEIPEELTKYSELNDVCKIIRTKEVVEKYKKHMSAQEKLTKKVGKAL